MIDITFFVVMTIIGTALMATGFFYVIYKTNVDKKIQKGVAGGLIVLIIGISLIVVGIDKGARKHVLGTPIEFSELQDQGYLSREVPQNWRIVRINSAQSEEDEWKVVKNFPVDFKFSEKKFIKYKEKIYYPQKSSP